MLNRRLHKLGTLLGLLAIWLTALAPTISQTLAAHERMGVEMALGVECSAQDAAPEPASSDGDQASHHHDALGHWDACGYCGFFAHLPVMPGLTPAVVSALAAAQPPYVAAAVEARRATRFLTAQPRAPPVVS
ncbi:DUF2946 domain-containing protein [Trinickia acidisoli]|uniref:DUF2946 domain-containing protein n=1 Tax=Trinickia acidisoli TaxID=2767482 RepID=UPI001A8D2423|nr:DUF2946 domain-containing protein [Trinickia acidisoli]